MANGRYDIVKSVKTNNDNNKVYRTLLYPKIEFSNLDIFIFGKQGDRLDLLAYKYYNDVTKWWIIAHANKIKGTMNVPYNMQLAIPMQIDKIMTNYRKLNS
jgi:nucleoid-associated protein YgaU